MVRKITNNEFVAILYPDINDERQMITLGQLKQHFTKGRLLELLNINFEPADQFKPRDSYDKILSRVMGMDVPITANPDRKRLPKNVTRIIF